MEKGGKDGKKFLMDDCLPIVWPRGKLCKLFRVSPSIKLARAGVRGSLMRTTGLRCSSMGPNDAAKAAATLPSSPLGDITLVHCLRLRHLPLRELIPGFCSMGGIFTSNGASVR